MFKLFKVLSLGLMAMAMSTTAYGGGDKVNNPWQPVDPNIDVCVAFLPPGLDLEDCEALASTTSGITYLCDTLEEYVVVCPQDDPVDEPDEGDSDSDGAGNGNHGKGGPEPHVMKWKRNTGIHPTVNLLLMHEAFVSFNSR